jgi:hypothetical protein
MPVSDEEIEADVLDDILAPKGGFKSRIMVNRTELTVIGLIYKLKF